MAKYSVSAAKDQLSRLIAKAEAGEEVIITRHGRPAVELRVAAPDKLEPGKVRAGHEWLRQRVQARPRVATGSADLLRLDNEDSAH